MILGQLRYLTFLGNFFPQLLICCLLIFLDPRNGFLVFGLWGWAYVLNLLIKNTIRRKRPPKERWRVPHVNGYSFPSGHSLTSLVLYWSIARYFLLPEPWSWLLYALPFVLGLSRLYLRVHFIEDVLGGWLIAYTYLYFAEAMVVKYTERILEIFLQAFNLLL